jgi:hypothetical protein
MLPDQVYRIPQRAVIDEYCTVMECGLVGDKKRNLGLNPGIGVEKPASDRLALWYGLYGAKICFSIIHSEVFQIRVLFISYFT